MQIYHMQNFNDFKEHIKVPNIFEPTKNGGDMSKLWGINLDVFRILLNCAHFTRSGNFEGFLELKQT